jgi:hypothetical protein
MFFLIKDGAVAGTSAELTDKLPEGFFLVEGTDSPLGVYWDGENILAKPQQPSPSHYWDAINNEWVLPFIPPVFVAEDWDKLTSLLDNSPEWGRAYSAAERTLKANTAFTTLLTTLTTLRKIETLQFVIAKLREAMSAISGLGDFSAEEIASINQKLTECGFELQLNV